MTLHFLFTRSHVVEEKWTEPVPVAFQIMVPLGEKPDTAAVQVNFWEDPALIEADEQDITVRETTLFMVRGKIPSDWGLWESPLYFADTGTGEAPEAG
jgi:hypothetical protein